MSLVTTPVLGWLEDSVVRSDSPDFGVAESFSTRADEHGLVFRVRAERITQLFRREPATSQGPKRPTLRD